MAGDQEERTPAVARQVVHGVSRRQLDKKSGEGAARSQPVAGVGEVVAGGVVGERSSRRPTGVDAKRPR